MDPPICVYKEREKKESIIEVQLRYTCADLLTFSLRLHRLLFYAYYCTCL